jgi:uncharacterized phiE125 gp8 family phage protein
MYITTKVTTKPEFKPVTLDQLKNQLEIELSDTSQDDQLTLYIEAATDYAEAYIKGKIMKQTATVYFSGWQGSFKLWGAVPLLSVVVKYTDENGDTQTLNADEYHVNEFAQVPEIQITGTTPTLQENNLAPVFIEAVCGYSDSAVEGEQQTAVPASIKKAILMKAAKMYEYRADYLTRQGMDAADHLLHLNKFH